MTTAKGLHSQRFAFGRAQNIIFLYIRLHLMSLYVNRARGRRYRHASFAITTCELENAFIGYAARAPHEQNFAYYGNSRKSCVKTIVAHVLYNVKTLYCINLLFMYTQSRDLQTRDY